VRQFLRRFINQLRGVLPSANRRVWLLVILPYALFLALLLSTGPHLQFYAFSALNNQAPSIYAAAHEEDLNRFPTYGDWLGYTFDPMFLVICIGAATIAFGAKSLRGAALLTGLCLFVAVSFIDIVLTLMGRSSSTLLAAIAGNFFGFSLVVIVAFVILCFYKYIAQEAQAAPVAAIVFPVAIIGIGLLISSAIYLGLQYLYQPLAERIQVVLSAPVSGTFGATAWERESRSRADRADRRLDRRFNVMPRGVYAQSASVVSPHGRMAVSWRRRSGSERYDLEVGLFSNCFRPPDIQALRMPRSSVVKRDVGLLRIRFDNGLSDLTLRNDGDGRFTSIIQAVSFFWVSTEGNPPRLRVSNYFSEGDMLRMASSLPVTFFVGAPLTRGSDGSATRRSRNLDIEIDGQTHRLRFGPDRLFRPQRRVRCRPLEAGQIPGRPGTFGSYPSVIPTDGIAAGVLVRISPRPEPTLDYTPFGTELTVSDANGWAAVEDLGDTSFLSFGGSENRLSLEGEELHLSPHNTMFMIGDFTGDVHPDSRTEIRGEAEGIWRDGTRLNKTKWERLSEGSQLTIIGAVLVAIGTLLRLLWPTLARAMKDEALVLP
jgi:hypothetical protein